MAGSAVWLDVLPSMSKFASTMTKQAGTAAKVAGLSAGKQFSAGVAAGGSTSAAKTLVQELEVASKRAARAIQAEKVAIAKARAEESAAAQGVQAAEARLAEQRKKYTAASSQALKAEQQLTSARGRQHVAGLKVVAVEDQLKAAFSEQKVVTGQLAAAQAGGAKQTALMSGRFSKLAAAGAPLSMGLGKVASGAKNVAASALGTLKPLAGMAAGFGAILGVSKVISLGNEYTRTMNELQAVSGLSAQQMVKFSKATRDLGADLSLPATSGKDAAAVMLELAKGGLTANEALKAARGTIILAAAAQTDGATAAEIQSNSLNQFGLAANKAGKVADVLANTANAASGGITDIAYSLKYVGPAARAVGANITSTAAAIGVLANQGLKGETAGTSLRSMLASLASPSKVAQKGLNGLGVEAFDASGKFLGLRSVVQQLSDAQKTMSQADFLDYVKKAFGKETLTAVTSLASAGVSGAKGYDAMLKSVSRTGGAATVAQSYMKGLGGSMDKLESQLEDVALGIYQTVTPALTGAVNGIAGGLDGAGGKVESFLKIAGGLGKLAFTGKVSAPISGIDPTVVAGIQTARNVIVGAFRDIASFTTESLIPSVKNIAIALGPVAAIVAGAFVGAFRAAAAVLKFIGPGLVAITGFFRANKVATVVLAAAIGGLVLAYKAFIVQQKILAAGGFAALASQIRIVAAAQKAWAFATWAATGAQRALNLALRANPIGLVITAIALLVAGFIWAYKNIGWFKTSVDAVWSAIQVGVKAVGAAFVWLWTNGIKPAVDWIAQAATWLWGTVLQPVFNAVVTAAKFVVGIYVSYFKLWIFAFKAVGAGAVWLWNNALKPAFAGIMVGVHAVGDAFSWWWTSIVSPVFNWIGKAAQTLWDGYLFPIFDLIRAVVMSVVAPAFAYFKAVVTAAWTGIVAAATAAWNTMSAVFLTAVGFLRNTFGAAFTWLRDAVIMPVFNTIVIGVRAWWAGVQVVFNAVVGFIRSTLSAAFTWLRDVIVVPVTNTIASAVGLMWSGLRVIFLAVVGFIRTTVGGAFTWLRDSVVKPVFDGIKGTISSVWTGGIKPIFDRIASFAKTTIPAAFNVMKDSVGKAWSAISTAAKAPIKFVVNTVINDALIGNFNKVAGVFGTKKMSTISLPKGFAGGGVIPGYQSARRDDVMTPMRRGEGVLVPEVVRALGPQFVHGLNAAGNRGGVAAVKQAAGYAKGGVVGKNDGADGGGLGGALKDAWNWTKGAAGNAWDWSKNAAETAANVVTDPMGTIGKLVKSAIGNIPGAGRMTDLAAGMGTKFLDGAVSLLKKMGGDVPDFGGSGANGQLPKSALTKVSGFAGGSGVGPIGGYLRTAAAAAWESMQAAFGGNLSLTEGYRDLANQQARYAAYRARRGNLAATPGTSVHGFGLAADVGGGSQAWMRANGPGFGWYPTGLSFAQREPWHFEYKGAKSKGYAAGGVIDGVTPTLYDKGGVIPRGVSVIENNLRDPEVALPMQTLRDIVSGGNSSKGEDHVHFHHEGRDFTIGDYMEAERRMEALRG